MMHKYTAIDEVLRTAKVPVNTGFRLGIKWR